MLEKAAGAYLEDGKPDKQVPGFIARPSVRNPYHKRQP